MPEDFTESASFIIDECSFKELYERYWEKVYAVCYNNIRQAEVAQGMVQDIYRSLWERRDSVEIVLSPERYLIRAAKFKVFEYIRNKKSRKEHTEKALCDYCDYTHSTENEVMYNSLKGQVARVVNGLPEKCRHVFTMSREEGLTNKEIARTLSITERAVEYHISRAIGVLKTQLHEYLS